MIRIRSWYMAVALVFAVILDGVFSFLMQGVGLNTATWFSVIGITLLGLCNDQNKYNFWLVLFIGFMADSFYLGFYGVYSVAFPLIYLLAAKSARFLPETFWARVVACLLAYLVMLVYFFFAFNIVGFIESEPSALLTSILPNLLTGLVITLLTYTFWVKLSEHYPFLDKKNNY